MPETPKRLANYASLDSKLSIYTSRGTNTLSLSFSHAHSHHHTLTLLMVVIKLVLVMPKTLANYVFLGAKQSYTTRGTHTLSHFFSQALTPPHLAFVNGCHQTSPGTVQNTYERLANYVFLGAKLSYTS